MFRVANFAQHQLNLSYTMRTQSSVAERQVEIENDGRAFVLLGRAPGDIVGDGRGTDAAARADKGDRLADRRGGRIDIKISDGLDDL